MPEVPQRLTIQDLHDRTALPLWHTVCGRRLLQLQFGHARLLEAMDLWDPRDPASLLVAVFICSRRWELARDQFQGRLITVRLFLWRVLLGTDWVRSRWTRSLAMWRKFVAYHLAEPMSAPAVPPGAKVERSRSINTPWLTHLKCTLCSRGGYDPAGFDSMPLGELMLAYYALLETENVVVLGNVTRQEYRELRKASA